MTPKEKKEELVKMKLEDQKKIYTIAFLLQIFGFGRLYTGDYIVFIMFWVLFIIIPFLGIIRRIIDFFLIYGRIIDINDRKEEMIRKEIDLIS